MSILITGGAGYIGSHTCVELLNAGEDIVLLDNFSNAKPEVIRRIREITGKDFHVCAVDLLHEQAVRKVFRDFDIEAVIHFAAFKAVGESVSHPLEYYRNNITGTINLCQAMAETNCKRLVFSSSATVYGTSIDVPYKEDSPLSATNPYGQTKVMIEQLLRDLHVSDNEWSSVSLRYFNLIGAHESGLLGDDPQGVPKNLPPILMQVATGRLKELDICGVDYDTPDGTCIRDYIHVSDLVDGHIAALRYARKHTGAEAVNLGTGHGYSVLEMVGAFEKACGKEIPRRIAPRRPGDIGVSYADITKAKAMLGWEAKKSIDEMCASAWRFAQANPHGI